MAGWRRGDGTTSADTTQAGASWQAAHRRATPRTAQLAATPAPSDRLSDRHAHRHHRCPSLALYSAAAAAAAAAVGLSSHLHGLHARRPTDNGASHRKYARPGTATASAAAASAVRKEAGQTEEEGWALNRQVFPAMPSPPAADFRSMRGLTIHDITQIGR